MNSDAASLAILATRGVTLARGGKTIARLPDLTVAAGQSMAIVGPSGCGKTTALMALAGIRAPQQGTITVEGTDLWTLGRQTFGWQRNAPAIPSTTTSVSKT